MYSTIPVSVCVTEVYCDKLLLPAAKFHQSESSYKDLTVQTQVAILLYLLQSLMDIQEQNLETPKILLVLHACKKRLRQHSNMKRKVPDIVVRSSIYALEQHHITSAAVTTIIPVHFPYHAIKLQVFALFVWKILFLPGLWKLLSMKNKASSWCKAKG